MLEDRISLFEKRISDTEKEIEKQTLIENRIFKLEKELRKNSHDSFIINTTLEKKTSDLQKKIHTDNPVARLDNLEKELQKKSNDSLTNKTTLEEKINDKKAPYLNKLQNINPSDWDLSEETIQRELDELKSNKK